MNAIGLRHAPPSYVQRPVAAMKPPICALCHKPCVCDGLADCGRWITFADYRPLPPGAAGHPAGLEWFCRQHRDAAAECSALTSEQAMAWLTAHHGDPAPSSSRPSAAELWVTDIGPQPIKVLALLRQADQLSPAQARQRMQPGSFRVLSADPHSLRRWHEIFSATGAQMEYRCP